MARLSIMRQRGVVRLSRPRCEQALKFDQEFGLVNPRRRFTISPPTASKCAPDRCWVACITNFSWRPRWRDRVIAEYNTHAFV